MITREQLEGISRKTGIQLAYQEKDYVQNVFLSSLSRKSLNSFVFKGGTCLELCHGLDRFSEDLDFDAIGPVESPLSEALKGLEDFGIEARLKESRKAWGGFGRRLVYKGPLYNGTIVSEGSIKLDFSERGSLALKPELSSVFSRYPDVPRFSILSMRLEEIMAEKVCALLHRKKARDLYDLRFLLGRGVRFDLGLADKKMGAYGAKFSKKKLEESIAEVGRKWETELRPLLAGIPDFAAVRKAVIAGL